MSSHASPRASPDDEAARTLLEMSRSVDSPSPSRLPGLTRMDTPPLAGSVAPGTVLAQGTLSTVRLVQSPLRPASNVARYSASAGRFTTPESERLPPPRVGLPLVDRTRPGLYRSITREVQPDAFRSAEEMQEVARFQRAHGLNSGVPAGSRPTPEVDWESEPESEPLEQVDDDVTGDYGAPVSSGKRPVVAARSGPAPLAAAGDINTVAATNNGDHQAWKVSQPQPRPLAFNVPTGLGTFKRELLPANRNIDFNDPVSVRAANKYARQVIHRARKAHGLPPLRTSTQGREYDQERNDMLEAIIVGFAAQNNGAQISLRELTDLYNEEYPDEDRSRESITSHINRVPELKAKRDSYRPR